MNTSKQADASSGSSPPHDSRSLKANSSRSEEPVSTEQCSPRPERVEPSPVASASGSQALQSQLEQARFSSALSLRCHCAAGSCG